MYGSNLATFVKSSLVKSVEVCNKSAISANWNNSGMEKLSHGLIRYLF